MEPKIQKITPNLWFNTQAEEAVQFYASIFQDTKIGRMTRYSKEGFEIHGMPEGMVLTIEFQIAGQEFVAMNGGEAFTFNEAVSFVINCTSQEEIDYYWDRLTQGGDENAQVCGWLKDKFGVSWQVVPVQLTEMLLDEDRAKADRVMHALLQMKKLELSELQKAYEG